MSFFSGPGEAERKANLKKFEDCRLKLAERLEREGFKPDRMLFCQADLGGFVATCRFGGKQWLIVSPNFGEDGECTVESSDHFDVRVQQIMIKGEGMGGMFGFGKKPQYGVEYHITRADGTEVVMPFVTGRNLWAEYTLAKNPLLKTKRRRGDANLVWDFKPTENGHVDKIKELAAHYFDL